MLPRQVPSAELLDLAAGQDGVLSTAQVHAAGLGRPALRRLLSDGSWQRLEQSLYFVHAHPPPWRAWAWGGVLLAGPGARVCGSAAAHLHGLLEEAPDLITVLTPLGEVIDGRGHWRFRRGRPGVRDRRSVGSPPRTTVEDTVLDLCDEASPAMAIAWVTRAVQERRTTAGRLADALTRRKRARHRVLLVDLLADVARGAESPLEVRYLRDVERAHHLPVGRRQDQREPGRRDVAYLEYGLVAELDGRLGHEGLGRFRDMVRDNRTTLRGEVTLRYGFVDVAGDPCAVARQVAVVLRRQGWTGTLVPCPRCPTDIA